MLSILKVCPFIRYSFCEELAVQLGRGASSEMVSQTGRIHRQSECKGENYREEATAAVV